MPVCTPLGQGLSAQLLVEEGRGKPPHHHPSSHFPSLDDTGVSPLSIITDLPYGRALIIIINSQYTFTLWHWHQLVVRYRVSPLLASVLFQVSASRSRMTSSLPHRFIFRLT